MRGALEECLVARQRCRGPSGAAPAARGRTIPALQCVQLLLFLLLGALAEFTSASCPGASSLRAAAAATHTGGASSSRSLKQTGPPVVITVTGPEAAAVAAAAGQGAAAAAAAGAAAGGTGLSEPSVVVVLGAPILVNQQGAEPTGQATAGPAPQPSPPPPQAATSPPPPTPVPFPAGFIPADAAAAAGVSREGSRQPGQQQAAEEAPEPPKSSIKDPLSAIVYNAPTVGSSGRHAGLRYAPGRCRRRGYVYLRGVRPSLQMAYSNASLAFNRARTQFEWLGLPVEGSGPTLDMMAVEKECEGNEFCIGFTTEGLLLQRVTLNDQYQWVKLNCSSSSSGSASRASNFGGSSSGSGGLPSSSSSGSGSSSSSSHSSRKAPCCGAYLVDDQGEYRIRIVKQGVGFNALGDGDSGSGPSDDSSHSRLLPSDGDQGQASPSGPEVAQCTAPWKNTTLFCQEGEERTEAFPSRECLGTCFACCIDIDSPAELCPKLARSSCRGFCHAVCNPEENGEELVSKEAMRGQLTGAYGPAPGEEGASGPAFMEFEESPPSPPTGTSPPPPVPHKEKPGDAVPPAWVVPPPGPKEFQASSNPYDAAGYVYAKDKKPTGGGGGSAKACAQKPPNRECCSIC